MNKHQIRNAAKDYIEIQFTDHDHCSQSSRAVVMFLRGVEWALEKIKEESPKFGPDVDHDAHVVWGVDGEL